MPDFLDLVRRLSYLGRMSTAGEHHNTPPEWTLTDRLRKAREVAGLDQAELAELIGVGRTSISNYEKAVSTPKRPVILSWALATGVPVEWLASGITPEPGPNEPHTMPGKHSPWSPDGAPAPPLHLVAPPVPDVADRDAA